MFISVIVPTYNPLLANLKLTIESLKNQTLSYQFWELIIVDNASTSNTIEKLDISWHLNFRILTEPRQGLTFARVKGFHESKGDIIIMVDDDNVLHENYLENALRILETNNKIGAIGGKSLPLFEIMPPKWVEQFHFCLALRDHGEQPIIESWENKYPDNAPIGAGMALRRTALTSYLNKIQTNKAVITDRVGNNLSSGGDNDIIFEISKSGWLTGYFPSLILFHIIPKERIAVKYLAKLLNGINKSWVLLLTSHNICPWQKIPSWSSRPRKIKAWFAYKAWQNEANYIRWKGVCGLFDGLAESVNFNNTSTKSPKA